VSTRRWPAGLVPARGAWPARPLAAYTLSRQFILGLRSEPPLRWRYGRPVTAVAAAATLIASVALLVRG
jgi:hypothetical protein